MGILERIFGDDWLVQLGGAAQPRWSKGDPRGGQWRSSLSRSAAISTPSAGVPRESLIDDATAEKLIPSTEPRYEELRTVLKNSGLQLSDLSRIGRITTAGNANVKEGPKGYRGPWNLTTDELVSGFYDRTDRSVHISRDYICAHTMTHEVGHHVGRAISHDREHQLTKVARALESETDDKLATYGLRRYSIRNSDELYADSFVVFRSGTPREQKNLLALLGEKSADDVLYREPKTRKR